MQFCQAWQATLHVESTNDTFRARAGDPRLPADMLIATVLPRRLRLAVAVGAAVDVWENVGAAGTNSSKSSEAVSWRGVWGE
jgi:hypothetical protein